jgi:hypothetical protein
VRQLEVFAERVRREAGVGGEEVVDAAELATRLLGDGSVVIVDKLACGARLRWTPTGYRIEIREGLADMNFACAHEVAHWAFRRYEHDCGPHEERMANYVGAALLFPRALVRSAVSFYGRGLDALEPVADRLMLSKTAVNLRLGEVLKDERVVVTRTGHVLRSDEAAFQEPDKIVVRVARDDRARTGLSKAPLFGGIDEGRVALHRR